MSTKERAKRGRGSPEGQAVPVMVVPPAKKAVPNSKNKKQRVAVANSGEDECDEDGSAAQQSEGSVNLSKTMLEGDLGRAKAAASAVAEAALELNEVEKLEAEMKMMKEKMADIEAKLEEFLQGVLVWEGIVEGLTARLISLEGGMPPEKDWTLDHLVQIDLFKRQFYMNNGHCSQATNQPYTYRVEEEEYGLCLHCFAQDRDPESCVFKGGRNGVRMHRKPKAKDGLQAKCCKPGIADRNDPKEIKMRMLFAKDFLVFT